MGIGWMPWVEKPGLTRSLTLALLALLPGACSHQPAKPLQDEYIGIGNGRLVYRDQQIHLVDGQWINNFDRTPVIGSGPTAIASFCTTVPKANLHHYARLPCPIGATTCLSSAMPNRSFVV